jgi:hypothetical protein
MRLPGASRRLQSVVAAVAGSWVMDLALPRRQLFLAVIDARSRGCSTAWYAATLWFSTPLSPLDHDRAGHDGARGQRATSYTAPALPRSRDSADLSRPGEQHHPTKPMRVAQPTWLTIRGAASQ